MLFPDKYYYAFALILLFNSLALSLPYPQVSMSSVADAEPTATSTPMEPTSTVGNALTTQVVSDEATTTTTTLSTPTPTPVLLLNDRGSTDTTLPPLAPLPLRRPFPRDPNHPFPFFHGNGTHAFPFPHPMNGTRPFHFRNGTRGLPFPRGRTPDDDTSFPRQFNEARGVIPPMDASTPTSSMVNGVAESTKTMTATVTVTEASPSASAAISAEPTNTNSAEMN